MECFLCQGIFDCEENLRKHIECAHTQPLFSCLYCAKFFSKAVTRDNHMLEIHKRGELICGFCGQTFNTLSALKDHQVRHKNFLFSFKCTICGRGFVDDNLFFLHMQRHICSGKFTCSKCGKDFRSSYGVKRHFSTCMSKAKPFSCDLCGKGYKTQDILRDHKRNKHAMGTVKICPVCHKKFLPRQSFAKHLSNVHKMNPHLKEIPCDISDTQ